MGQTAFEIQTETWMSYLPFPQGIRYFCMPSCIVFLGVNFCMPYCIVFLGVIEKSCQKLVLRVSSGVPNSLMKHSHSFLTYYIKLRQRKSQPWRRFGYQILISIDFDDFTDSLVFVAIEKIYPTLETVFHRLSKHLEFRQKYAAVRRIFNSLLSVWISPWNTVSLVWYIISSTLY